LRQSRMPRPCRRRSWAWEIRRSRSCRAMPRIMSRRGGSCMR